jgi:hypothetical protein
MAKNSGGGGGVSFGWTLLGFLAGIAATLGVQILMGDDGSPSRAEASAGAVHITVRSSEPAAKPAKKAALAAAPSAAPKPAAAAAVQPAAEMADDAAAAGMTSRITPADEPGGGQAATLNN